MTPLVDLQDVRVHINGTGILHGVTAQVPSGQVTAVIGPNGSGKSTLLRVLLGEIPYTGQVKYLGQRRGVGYVPQRLQSEASLPITVRDLLALAVQQWPLFLGVTRATEDRIRRMLARVWAEHLLGRLIENLSGGELQRVLLALALEPQPELLLLDEPARGIDPARQGQFYDLISQLSRELGFTVLLVSHELEVVRKHAHRVMCLRDGRLVAEGSPAETLRPVSLAGIFGTDTSVFGG